jgi:hypothetical protein
MKRPGARWRVKRLERIAALCCLHPGDQGDAYRKKVVGQRPDPEIAPSPAPGRPASFRGILMTSGGRPV